MATKKKKWGCIAIAIGVVGIALLAVLPYNHVSDKPPGPNATVLWNEGRASPNWQDAVRVAVWSELTVGDGVLDEKDIRALRGLAIPFRDCRQPDRGRTLDSFWYALASVPLGKLDYNFLQQLREEAGSDGERPGQCFIESLDAGKTGDAHNPSRIASLTKQLLAGSAQLPDDPDAVDATYLAFRLGMTPAGLALLRQRPALLPFAIDAAFLRHAPELDALVDAGIEAGDPVTFTSATYSTLISKTGRANEVLSETRSAIPGTHYFGVPISIEYRTDSDVPFVYRSFSEVHEKLIPAREQYLAAKKDGTLLAFFSTGVGAELHFKSWMLARYHRDLILPLFEQFQHLQTVTGIGNDDSLLRILGGALAATDADPVDGFTPDAIWEKAKSAQDSVVCGNLIELASIRPLARHLPNAIAFMHDTRLYDYKGSQITLVANKAFHFITQLPHEETQPVFRDLARDATLSPILQKRAGDLVSKPDPPQTPKMRLGKNHPIFRMPTFEASGTESFIGRLALRVQWSDFHEPEWELRLLKRSFVIGEPIVATIKVTNKNDARSIKLSPPFIGERVATLAVWNEKLVVGERSKGVLPTAIKINNGFDFRSEYWPQLQGVPLVLKPGESFSASVILNVCQSPFRDGRKPGPDAMSWYGGFGFSSPGKYRVYLQYVNMEELAPFARRDGPRSYLEGMKSANEPIDIDPMPIVIGPVELEIRPPATEAEDVLAKLVPVLEEVAAQHMSDYSDIADLSAVAPAAVKLTRENADLQSSMVLTAIRDEFTKLDAHPSEARNEKIESMLTRLRAQSTATSPGPLLDAYKLTECHMLASMNQTEKAVALASTMDSPDALVFVHEHKPKTPTPGR